MNRRGRNSVTFVTSVSSDALIQILKLDINSIRQSPTTHDYHENLSRSHHTVAASCVFDDWWHNIPTFAGDSTRQPGKKHFLVLAEFDGEKSIGRSGLLA